MGSTSAVPANARLATRILVATHDSPITPCKIDTAWHSNGIPKTTGIDQLVGPKSRPGRTLSVSVWMVWPDSSDNRSPVESSRPAR